MKSWFYSFLSTYLIISVKKWQVKIKKSEITASFTKLETWRQEKKQFEIVWVRFLRNYHPETCVQCSVNFYGTYLVHSDCRAQKLFLALQSQFRVLKIYSSLLLEKGLNLSCKTFPLNFGNFPIKNIVCHNLGLSETNGPNFLDLAKKELWSCPILFKFVIKRMHFVLKRIFWSQNIFSLANEMEQSIQEWVVQSFLDPKMKM